MMIRQSREKAYRKIKGSGGYSLAEVLICVLILLLVSGIMINGYRFALEQYKESMESSQATILCSTLEEKITARLQELPAEDFDSDSANKPVFVMAQINADGTVDTSKTADYGSVMLGKGEGTDFDGEPLLPAASYTYGLRAKAKMLTSSEEGFVKVKLKIVDTPGDGENETTLTEEVFEIRLD